MVVVHGRRRRRSPSPLIRASDDGWVSGPVLGLLVAGVRSRSRRSSLIERRSDHALLDLGLFRNRSFVGVMMAALLINFAAFAYFTYTSIWLQSLLGLSPDRGRPDRAAAVGVRVPGLGGHRPVPAQVRARARSSAAA